MTPTSAAQAPDPKSVDPKLLALLVCPVTHGPLELDPGAGELISRAAGLAYPIRDGVPVMLPEEARRLGASAQDASAKDGAA